MDRPLIANVSDTARWMAALRASESSRPDALFRDPLADRLAGDHGRAIAAAGPRSARSGWPMIARTKLFDELILQSLSEGCDRVVNLAAGLDTRPYRLDLPPSLVWVEADLPAMVDEKERLLAGETPRCRLQRERVDLSDAGARSSFLDRALLGSSKALVLSEGLVVYLDGDQVSALARDLKRAPVRWWVVDVTSPPILKMIVKGMGSHLENAPMKFAPPEGVAFFERLGWQARDIRPIFRAAAQYRRLPALFRLFAFLPDPNPRKVGNARWSAVLRLERPA